MTVLSMSKQEFRRLDVLLRVQSGWLRVADACALMGLHRRQVFRLLRGLKQDGATSQLSKRRGKPSNHRLPPEVRALALSLVRERYVDFGPTFAAEKLAELHGCSVSRKTLRGWMVEDGLWIDRRHRLPSPHQPRRRRDCLGELVQIDGSEHAWFEDDGAACTLLAFVDDATSRLMQLRFVVSESAFDYFGAGHVRVCPTHRPLQHLRLLGIPRKGRTRCALSLKNRMATKVQNSANARFGSSGSTQPRLWSSPPSGMLSLLVTHRAGVSGRTQ
jgi:hypothetical protein